MPRTARRPISVEEYADTRRRHPNLILPERAFSVGPNASSTAANHVAPAQPSQPISSRRFANQNLASISSWRPVRVIPGPMLIDHLRPH